MAPPPRAARWFGLLLLFCVCLLMVVGPTSAIPSLQIQKTNPYDTSNSSSNSNQSSEDENSLLSSLSSSSSQTNNNDQVVGHHHNIKTTTATATTETISTRRKKGFFLVLTKKRNNAMNRRRRGAASANNGIQESLFQQQSKSTSYDNNNNNDSVPDTNDVMKKEQRTTTAIDIHQRNTIKRRRKERLVVSLMGLTGIVEAICYRRFGCFPNMMTGNTVRFMDSIASLQYDSIIFYIMFIGSYVIGSAISKLFLDEKSTPLQDNNNNNNINSKPKQPSLIQVGRIAFVLLSLSDLVAAAGGGGKTSSSSLSSFSRSSRLSLMAIAFGMINAATQKETGSVTNAITGHWGKIGGEIGSSNAAEKMLLMLFPSSKSKSTTVPAVVEKHNKPSSTGGLISLSLSLRCALIFMLSLLVTTSLMMWAEKESHHHHHYYVSMLLLPLQRLPPLGISLGILYNLLFSWYYCNSSSISSSI